MEQTKAGLTTEAQILAMLHQNKRMTVVEMLQKYLPLSDEGMRDLQLEIHKALSYLRDQKLIHEPEFGCFELRPIADDEYVFILAYRDYVCGDYETRAMSQNNSHDANIYNSINNGEKFLGIRIETELKTVKREFSKQIIQRVVRDSMNNILWIDAPNDQPKLEQVVITEELMPENMDVWKEFTNVGFDHKATVVTAYDWKFIRKVYKPSMFIRFTNIQDFMQFLMSRNPRIESSWYHSTDLFGYDLPYLLLGLGD